MENFGAEVYASPTDRTHAGRAALGQDPDNSGSLGLAIPEAVEVAAASGGAKKYSLGSVLNHVLMHQTVIGEEALMQTLAPGASAGVEMAGEYPDFVTLAPEPLRECRCRLRRRREQLRRLCLPLPASEFNQRQERQDPHLAVGQVSSLWSRPPARA